MQIGTAPINWNNEDVPDYRPWVPYPRILDEIVRAGYGATEWSSSLPTDVETLRSALNERKLALTSAFTALELRNPERRMAEVEKALEKARFLYALGAPYLIAADSGDELRQQFAGHVAGDQGLTTPQWVSLISGLHEIAEAVRPLGMRVVFHNHVGTYVETPEETARLLENTDPALVGWCLDTGHLAYGGGDVLDMVRRYGQRVGYVHLKDVDGAVFQQAKAEGWGWRDALRRYIFTFLGDGVARVPEVLEALADAGYDGWLIPEQDTTPIDPTETARRNLRYLEGVLARR